MNGADSEKLCTEDEIRNALMLVFGNTIHPRMFFQVIKEMLAEEDRQAQVKQGEVDQRWINPFDRPPLDRPPLDRPPQSPKFRDFDGSF